MRACAAVNVTDGYQGGLEGKVSASLAVGADFHPCALRSAPLGAPTRFEPPPLSPLIRLLLLSASRQPHVCVSVCEAERVCLCVLFCFFLCARTYFRSLTLRGAMPFLPQEPERLDGLSLLYWWVSSFVICFRLFLSSFLLTFILFYCIFIFLTESRNRGGVSARSCFVRSCSMWVTLRRGGIESQAVLATDASQF